MTPDPVLDDLRAEIAALRGRLADLESRVAAAPPASEPDALEPAAPEPAGRRVTRRGLLAAAVAGGAGLVATQVTTAAPAAAAPGNGIVLGAVNDGGGTITTVRSETGLNSSPFAVVNYNTNGASIGFFGQLGRQSQMFDGSIGQRAGVMGDSYDQTGVSGLSTDGIGVLGQSRNNVGVKALSEEYSAVRAESTKFYGVYAASYSADYAAVLGTSPAGTGVAATSQTGTALQAGTGGAGAAVDASSTKGLGVLAAGGRAPLRLVPSTKAGAPTSGKHGLGELYVDKNGALWLCTVAGTPGTWRKVALV